MPLFRAGRKRGATHSVNKPMDRTAQSCIPDRAVTVLFRGWSRVTALLLLVLVQATAAVRAADPGVPATPQEVETAVVVRGEREARLAARLDELTVRLQPAVGGWIGRDVIPGVTWLQVVFAVMSLLVTAILAAILGWALRCWIRREEREAAEIPTTEGPGEPAEAMHLVKHTLEAALPPLRLMVWILGGYLAAAALLIRVAGSGAPIVLRALDWLLDVGGIVALFWFIYRMIAVIGVRVRHWASRSSRKWDDIFAVLVLRALRMIVPLIGVILILPTLSIPDGARTFFRQAVSLLLIGAIGFIAYQLARAFEKAILEQFRTDQPDNLHERKITTQVQVLRKIVVVVIFVFTAGSMLMVFESVRQVGASVLTSAGVAGIIIGFAAQKSIAAVLAGFQIAMTQPIRIDDAVIVEGEWGRVEEITLTYVVIKIWDLRRLIVPISYFIEHSFQNWTRTSAEITGVVFIYTDFGVPIPALRAETGRIVTSSKYWNGKFWVLQVTDFTERTVQVRILASAADSGKAFDLRCEIRERLLEFIRQNYPESFPRVRTELPAPLPPVRVFSSPFESPSEKSA